jgi:hypothetical protein
VSAVGTTVEDVGRFAESHADLILGGATVACFIVAPEASPACFALGASAFTAGFVRSAIDSGLVGDGPANYCQFGLSVGASAVFFGTGFAIRQLWKAPYVLGEIDRRILRATTQYAGGTLNYVAGVGAAGLCSWPARGLGASAKNL